MTMMICLATLLRKIQLLRLTRLVQVEEESAVSIPIDTPQEFTLYQRLYFHFQLTLQVMCLRVV